MAKILFPYSTASSVVLVPQDEPLGALTARIIESSGIVTGFEHLWHERMRLATPDYQSNPGVSQLADPLASLVATDIIVAFETFFRQIDLTLSGTVGGLFVWPSRKSTTDDGKPYGFYFYRLDDVRKHFRNIFGTDVFYGTPFRQLKDYVKFRHTYAHRNGFPARNDRGQFRYYRIHCQRRLLLNVTALPVLYKTIHTSAMIVNNRIARVTLPCWLKSRASLSWSKNSYSFSRVCKAFSFFGSLKRDPIDIKGYYQALVQEYNPADAALTQIQRDELPLEHPWNRIKFSEFAA